MATAEADTGYETVADLVDRLGGVDGFLRLAPEIARGPDVSFVSWDRLPGFRLALSPLFDRAFHQPAR